MTIALTRAEVLALGPCGTDRIPEFGPDERMTARQALAAGATVRDLLWVLGELGRKDVCVRYAVACAQAVAHLAPTLTEAASERVPRSAPPPGAYAAASRAAQAANASVSAGWAARARAAEAAAALARSAVRAAAASSAAGRAADASASAEWAADASEWAAEAAGWAAQAAPELDTTALFLAAVEEPAP